MKTISKATISQAGWAMLASLTLAACAPSAPEAAQPTAATAPADVEKAPVQPAVPAHALITLPVGAEVPVDYTKQVASWLASGQVSNALVLQQMDGGAKTVGFSGLTVLDFPSEAAYDSWKSQSANSLDKSLIVSRVDILTNTEKTPRDSSHAIFVVSQYESLVSPEAYQAYTDAYVVPNMANQTYSGIMTRYTMYLEREASGEQARPKAVLLSEYANQAEFDRKKSVKDAYKAVLLATHPEWKRINDSKDEIRVDLSETLARKVQLP